MKKTAFFLAMFCSMSACEKAPDKTQYEFNARIAGFDLNCSTCILEFPEDSVRVKNEIGASRNNFYQATNLPKGDFQVGQRIRVNIRKPEANEIRACITMYPSFDYTSVFVSDYKKYENLELNDTILIPYHDCVNYPEGNLYLCFDSVLSESRCPTGAYCFWQGNAKVRFRLEPCNAGSFFFSLNTFGGFTRDTTIAGLDIKLLNLNPWPDLNARTFDRKDYKAQLVVTKK